MEKEKILAIVLSMAVMVGFFIAQEKFFPPSRPQAPTPAETPITTPAEQIPAAPQSTIADTVEQAAPIQSEFSISSQDEELFPQTVVVETDIMQVTFTNAGGNIVSYKLKNHLDKGEPVDMILTGNVEGQAFAIALGNREDVMSGRVKPVQNYFRVRTVNDLTVEFSRDFSTPQGGYVTLVKRYEFKPDEYMFELTVFMDARGSAINFGGSAYTLIFGPQIGPKFEKLDLRYEYRHYLTYNKKKLKKEKVTEKNPVVITNQPSWAAIAGKYFALIALPYASNFELALSSQSEEGLSNASRMYLTRPASPIPRIEDKYHFYLGPTNQDALNMYERGENSYKLRETGFVELVYAEGFLRAPLIPLEKGLKWLLSVIYKIIPNYGIAIILVTILVKALMFPLTKKGSEGTIRMQALSPQIKEIQTKYKENPQRMNAEMAAFYKREGYNPLSGCLPMLLQFPIFIGMFNLFNYHFDLRGAMFIPGWIPDLSIPESIYNFPDNFKLPFLGWTALRLLPFIYVASQLLFGKVTQTPSAQQGAMQMKMMLYVMPIVFFFILYDVPSGLLVYWIMSNLLSLVQQIIINKHLARKKAAAAALEPPQPVIATNVPKKKKKK